MNLTRRVVARYLGALTKRDLPPAFREEWGRFVQRIGGSDGDFEVVVSIPSEALDKKFGGAPDKMDLKREFSRYFTFSSKVPGGVSGRLVNLVAQRQGGDLKVTIEWQERWGL